MQGDNLHALEALLPRYPGQVKCIYIDPPYNTGKEGETLDRHDRWLSMMYPRLVPPKQFLRNDGAILVSIDDNEVATLRLQMDDRLIGGLWANLSEGRCRFVMIKDRRWELIEEQLRRPAAPHG